MVKQLVHNMLEGTSRSEGISFHLVDTTFQLGIAFVVNSGYVSANKGDVRNWNKAKTNI